MTSLPGPSHAKEKPSVAKKVNAKPRKRIARLFLNQIEFEILTIMTAGKMKQIEAQLKNNWREEQMSGLATASKLIMTKKYRDYMENDANKKRLNNIAAFLKIRVWNFLRKVKRDLKKKKDKKALMKLSLTTPKAL